MIELQGDRYVQVSGEDNSGAEMVDRDPTTRHRVANASPGAQSSGAPSLAAQGRNELPPAILVFRDGRREEVSGYTITDGVLYASGDFYAGGSWNRKIELSSLNLAETIESNRSRGIEFRLPAAANEVIVRP